jgi:hypothetical protein
VFGDRPGRHAPRVRIATPLAIISKQHAADANRGTVNPRSLAPPLPAAERRERDVRVANQPPSVVFRRRVQELVMGKEPPQLVDMAIWNRPRGTGCRCRICYTHYP